MRAGPGDIIVTKKRNSNGSLTTDAMVEKIRSVSKLRTPSIPLTGTDDIQSYRSTPNRPAHSGDDGTSNVEESAAIMSTAISPSLTGTDNNRSTSNLPDHSKNDRITKLEESVAKMNTTTSPLLTGSDDMQSVRSASNHPALSWEDRITNVEKEVATIGTAFEARIQALTTTFEAKINALNQDFGEIYEMNELLATNLMGVSNKIMFLKRTSNNLRLLVTASGRRCQNKEGLGQSKVLLHGVLRNCPLVH